ncbi:aldose epimerase family protein [Gynuella sunshinyii]|uniref:Aldose 1-epimerase n=1 Tax=Gynuella sunshinyii YC6258 TaxID=1445510 RepID=A0A0C5W111_9GAMM|nr:aldose epimerase family protein [Gynuella sunshinyii]AJQ96374.1 galactose mutarotase-related enzyme [Gynuella sunshinyii YC6258]
MTAMVSRQIYGLLPDQSRAELVVLKNSHGNEISICNFGLNVTDLMIADQNGQPTNVVLGCGDLKGFYEQNIGLNSIVGRFANRIDHGRMPVGDKVYQLDCNLGPHHLHGNNDFSKNLWTIKKAELTDGIPTLVVERASADGEHHYPGNVLCTITITFDDDNRVRFDIHATTDQPTHLNVTHHAYFNLSGQTNQKVTDHLFKIHGSQVTECDELLIPSGELVSVKGGVLDFTDYRSIEDALNSGEDFVKHYGGIDHNFVIKTQNDDDLMLQAEAINPETGIRLQVSSTQPGVQFFTGQVLDGTQNREGGVYQNFAGFCLEPQHFPDTPNHKHFPSTLITPEHAYHETIEWQFDIYHP